MSKVGGSGGRRRGVGAALAVLVTAGCQGSDPRVFAEEAGPEPVTEAPAAEVGHAGEVQTAPWADAPRLSPGPAYPRPCHPLYADDVVPHFEVELAPEDWAEIEAEAALQVEGAEQYYPIVFRYDGEVVTNAMMRLRGNRSRCRGKGQFAIAFNQVDPDGRFRGLRRINLDHGSCRIFRDRLALAYMREDLGLPAACANHATLSVNGEFYGIFTNIEHVNKDFLKRNFAEHDGNLYKSGKHLKTNEETGDDDEAREFRHLSDYQELDARMDLDEAVLEWAGEAVLPARDNFWVGSFNFYLYSHPARGFLFIPTDLDQAFPLKEEHYAIDRMFPASPRHPADLVLGHPEGRAKYEAALYRAIEAYDPERFEARLESWWSVMGSAAERDPHYEYSHRSVESLARHVRGRSEWLRSWAAERQSSDE